MKKNNNKGTMAPKRHGDKGTTLVEMMLALVCLSIIAMATYELIVSTHTTNATLNAWNMLTQWGQTAINKINADVTQGRILYQNDSVGTAYRTQLQSDATYPVFTSSTPALIDDTGNFGKDTTVSRTGNTLLFVVESPPFIGNALTTTRRVDIYRIIYYYLSSVNQPIGKMSSSLRLVKWTSNEFADYNQVMSISAGATRTDFVTRLYADREIRYLWLPHELPNNGFYAIDASGNVNPTPEPSFTIPKDTAESVVNDLGLGSASVAWNTSANFWPPDSVPKFANGNSVGDGFPHGLEIQIIGPSGARQVLVRLVLAYYIPIDGSIYSNESTTIIALKEY